MKPPGLSIYERNPRCSVSPTGRHVDKRESFPNGSRVTACIHCEAILTVRYPKPHTTKNKLRRLRRKFRGYQK